MMRDLPIIFSGPMVLALLAGRKTQTRRLAWRTRKDGSTAATWAWHVRAGDRLWVRENHAYVGGGDPGLLLCQADWRETAARHRCENAEQPPKWTPSIHMPRRASRITLTVQATRSEPLQRITEQDAIAEGWPRRDGIEDPEVHADAARDWYMDLFESLHGVGIWRQNPEVVVLTFTVEQRNIDA